MKEHLNPAGFYFSLQIDGALTYQAAAFQEVSGLTALPAAEEIPGGGQNQYEHQGPVAGETSNLVLRRGFIGRGSALATWVTDTLSSNLSKPIQTRTIRLSLLDGESRPLASWLFQDAWPVRVAMSELSTSADALAIETLKFACQPFQRR